MCHFIMQLQVNAHHIVNNCFIDGHITHVAFMVHFACIKLPSPSRLFKLRHRYVTTSFLNKIISKN